MYRVRSVEKSVGDGPALNYLSVLQWLCEKVVISKVDSYYPFHPDSLFDFKEESCIRATLEEFTAWTKSLSKLFKTVVIKFSYGKCA